MRESESPRISGHADPGLVCQVVCSDGRNDLISTNKGTLVIPRGSEYGSGKEL